MVYAATAAETAPAGAREIWVTPANFPAVESIVTCHHRSGAPLFASGTAEEPLQFGSPFGIAAGTGANSAAACKGNASTWSH